MNLREVATRVCEDKRKGGSGRGVCELDCDLNFRGEIGEQGSWELSGCVQHSRIALDQGSRRSLAGDTAI